MMPNLYIHKRAPDWNRMKYLHDDDCHWLWRTNWLQCDKFNFWLNRLRRFNFQPSFIVVFSACTHNIQCTYGSADTLSDLHVTDAAAACKEMYVCAVIVATAATATASMMTV